MLLKHKLGYPNWVGERLQGQQHGQQLCSLWLLNLSMCQAVYLLPDRFGSAQLQELEKVACSIHGHVERIGA